MADLWITKLSIEQQKRDSGRNSLRSLFAIAIIIQLIRISRNERRGAQMTAPSLANK